jgi:gamma-glutamylaminecyclotransferase
VNRTLLFVYGTLLPGEPSHALLASSENAGPACTSASFELGDCGEYPALCRGGTSAVLGELYWIADATLAMLDEFEGHPHLFRRSRIALADGRDAEAYLAGPGAPAPLVSIPGGDWRAWRKRAR